MSENPSTSFSISNILGKRPYSNPSGGPRTKRLKFSVESMLAPKFSIDEILKKVDPLPKKKKPKRKRKDFSVENLIDVPTRAPRSIFSIDNILAPCTSTDQFGGAAYSILKRETKRNAKFSLFNKIILFQFNFKVLNNPIEDMVQVLDDFIIKELSDPLKVSIKLRNLASEFDINIPFEKPKRSYYNAIMAKFEELEQSDSYTGFSDGKVELHINQCLKKSGQGRISKLLNQENINQNALLDVQIDNNLCLFNSLIAAKIFATGTKTQRMKLSRKLEANTDAKKAFWKNEAEALMTVVGAPLNGVSFAVEDYGSRIIDHFNSLGNDKFRLGAFDATSAEKPFYKYGPSTAKFSLHILFFKNHYCAIKKVSSLTKSPKEHSHYCLDCEKSFTSIITHNSKCPRKCTGCCSWGPNFPCQPDGGSNSHCSICQKSFWNRACYLSHLKRKICSKYKKCNQCGVTFKVSKKKPHNCLFKYCYTCGDYHEKRECYITKLEPKEAEPYRLLTFDFECTQDLETEVQNVTLHEVNCIVAKVTCTNCIINPTENCDVCGNEKLKRWNASKEDNILEKFVNWMFFKLPVKYKTLSIAHCGGRYDFVLLLKELYNRAGLKIRMIRNGNKFFQINVKGGKKVANTVFKDSYNFFQGSLDSLVSTFDLNVEPKPFFPHGFNRACNYNLGLSHLPPKETYFYESFMPKKKEEFLKFYEENYNTPFLLSEELEIYCTADVEILHAAVLKFRKDFLELTGMDAFQSATTIAGLCQRYWRQEHMEEKEHAIIPETGFENIDKSSREAKVYFMWLNEKKNKNIRYSESEGGEQRILNYKVDGIEGNTVYEYDGCHVHGCSDCFNPETVIRSGVTNEKAMAKTEARKQEIRDQGYEVITIKSCEVKEMRKTDADLDKYFKEAIIEGAISFRESFTGGRTHPMAMYAVSDDEHEILYKDVVSLYPSVNYFTEYPCGMPKIHKFNNHMVNWTTPEDNQYKGLIKCRVLPPQNLTLPVLPLRSKDRLLFPLCAACGNDFKGKNNCMSNYECKHPPKARSFVTTATHLELNLALSHGYIVNQLFRVYEYTKWSSNVFKSYVRKFLKLKVENSGWPSEVQTDAQKADYIRSYKQMFDIDIEADKVRLNKGFRFISKICLNSLWGRFANRNTLSSTIVTQNSTELYNIVNDDTKIVSDIDWISDTSVMVSFKEHEDFISTHDASNVLLSLWTTSAARCVLFKYLHEVNITDGCQLLYCDTDSVIYVCRRGQDPIPCGMFLGEMSNELPDHDIEEFVSSGAKQYGLKLKHKTTGDTSYNLKLRGITLNSKVLEDIHYESFKTMVKEYQEEAKVTVNYNSILPNKAGFIQSKVTKKTYRPFFDKGIISLPSLKILPFGFKES